MIRNFYLKAVTWLTAVVMMASGAALAEAPEGEIHISDGNKTTVEDSIENIYNENDVVKVDETTGEEVIVAQKDSKEIEIQEKLQQICSKIDEVAEELNGEIQPMTKKEYDNKIKTIADTSEEVMQYNFNVKAGVTAYIDVINFEFLPDNIKSKVIKEYTNNFGRFMDNYFGGQVSISDAINYNSDIERVLYCSEAQANLIQAFDELYQDLVAELQSGQINGVNFEVTHSAYGYALETLPNSGIVYYLINKDCYATGIAMHKVAKELNGYGKFYNSLGARTDEPLPENPITEEEKFIATMDNIDSFVFAHLNNPGAVLDGQVDIGSKGK